MMMVVDTGKLSLCDSWGARIASCFDIENKLKISHNDE